MVLASFVEELEPALCKERVPVYARKGIDGWNQEQLGQHKVGAERCGRFECIQVQTITNGRRGRHPKAIAKQAPDKEWYGKEQDWEVSP